MFKQKYCNMKYRINEQQLNSIITNSTLKVLSEAMEDEGLGRFLGDMAGRIRNGINKFTGDFNAARNNRMYQKRDYDSYQNYGYDPNSRNFDPNTARQYKDAKNAGASRASMGSFSTQYGDTVQGAQPQGNPQVAPQNTQQAEKPSALQNGPQDNPQMMNQPKVDGNAAGEGNQSIDPTRKLNRTVPAKQKAAGGGQNNKAYDDMSDEDLANSGMLSGGKPMTPKTTAKKSYMPNQAFTQDSYNQMKAQGQERPRIPESKLNDIIKESVKKVLNEIGDTAQGQYMLGRLAARQAKKSGDWNWKCNTTEQPAWQYGVKQLEKKYPNAYDRIAKDIPLNAGAYHQEQLYDKSKYIPQDEYTKRVKDNIRNQYNGYKQDPNYLDKIK